MGKYMRKAKTTGSEVAVMDLALGVRTRAKTLAFRRRKNHSPPPPTLTATSTGYLQLRSRRLVKPPVSSYYRKRQKHNINSNVNYCGKKQNPKSEADSVRSREESWSGQEREDDKRSESCGNNESKEGENILNSEARERNARESTPCSLIRDPEVVTTPCSANRPTTTTETNRRIENSIHIRIPTAHNLEDFFSGPEKELQRKFIDKYNFDPISDKPLPGRFEWMELDP